MCVAGSGHSEKSRRGKKAVKWDVLAYVEDVKVSNQSNQPLNDRCMHEIPIIQLWGNHPRTNSDTQALQGFYTQLSRASVYSGRWASTFSCATMAPTRSI